MTLSGWVTRPTLKSDAERVLKQIEGVESINNRIEVLPLSPNDDRIRRGLFYSLFGWDSPLYRYAVITDSVEGLVLVDIDTMANGEFRDNKLTRALTWNPDNVLKGARHVTLAGNYAYVTTDAGLVVVDLSATRLVDHTVMAKLRELDREFTQRGIALAIVGLDDHVSLSLHPAAARLRGIRPTAPSKSAPAQTSC